MEKSFFQKIFLSIKIKQYKLIGTSLIETSAQLLIFNKNLFLLLRSLNIAQPTIQWTQITIKTHNYLNLHIQT